VDAPPLLESADAILLGHLAGGALLVARPGHVRRTQLAEGMAILERADVNVLGVVLNG
jgi:Mrp family chromosome partitioning ATPase